MIWVFLLFVLGVSVFLLSRVQKRVREIEKEIPPMSARDFSRYVHPQKNIAQKLFAENGGRPRREEPREPAWHQTPPPTPPPLPDCFILLGFHQKPSLEELKAKYRLLAKIHHPDRGGDAMYFRTITDAYEEAKKYLRTS